MTTASRHFGHTLSHPTVPVPQNPNETLLANRVATLINSAKTMTVDETSQLAVAWNTTRDSTRDAAWDAAWYAAKCSVRAEMWVAARHQIWDVTRHTMDDTRDATRAAVAALIVKDLIADDEFDLLYGPWKSVIS